MTLGVQAFPTFQFYVNNKKVDELKGANPRALEDKILQHKVSGAFGGSGYTLGASAAPAWNGVGQPPGPGPVNARDARLRALGQLEAKKPSSEYKSSADVKTSATLAKDVPDEDDELAMAIALSLAEAKANEKPSATAKGPPAAAVVPSAADESDDVINDDGEEKAPPASKALSAEEQDAKDQADAEHEYAKEEMNNSSMNSDNGGWDEEMVPVPVDEGILAELMSMGFSDVRARKSIVHGKNLEDSLTWLTEHIDDPDIDQPYMVRKRDTIPKVPLTAEEKAKRIAEMKVCVENADYVTASLDNHGRFDSLLYACVYVHL